MEGPMARLTIDVEMVSANEYEAMWIHTLTSSHILSHMSRLPMSGVGASATLLPRLRNKAVIATYVVLDQDLF